MALAHFSIGINSRPAFIVPLACALLITLGVGPNFMLVGLSCAVLIVGVYLLWRPGEAQILLFLFAYQWLQATLPLFVANIRGIPVSELLIGFPGMGQAALIVIGALLVLAIGMRLGAGPQRSFHLARMRSVIWRVPPLRWLQLHVVVWGLSLVAKVLASEFPGLSQPLLTLANFKWVTYVTLTIVTFTRPDASRTLWIVVFVLEFLTAIGGFFSTFKFVFFFTLISITAIGARVGLRQVVSGAVISLMLLILGLYWTAIKPAYRDFVSGGERAQIVSVSYVDAFGKIIDLVAEVDARELTIAANNLASRFSELDMFSAVLVYVPEVMPHEWGNLWWDSITRPFMPRILFPDKPIIDESEHSRKYTGIQMAGIEEGTQISIGYIADSYIDFSVYGIWGALLMLGYLLGRIYRWFVEHPNGQGILGFGLACAVFLPIASIGTSLVKIVGALIVFLLVAAIVLNFVIPKFLGWLRA